MAYEYVKQFYGVNPVVGARVTSKDGKYSGVIVGTRTQEQYVHVRIDGQKHASPFHPMDLNYEQKTA